MFWLSTPILCYVATIQDNKITNTSGLPFAGYVCRLGTALSAVKSDFILNSEAEAQHHELKNNSIAHKNTLYLET